MANPKDTQKKKRKRQRSDDIEDAIALALEDQPVDVEQDQEPDATRKPKKARVDEKRSLFVRSLPPSATNESLADFFAQHFPVKHAVVVRDHDTKESRGYGFVTLADADDAADARKILDKTAWEGKSIRVDVAEPRHRKTTTGGSDADAPAKAGKSEARKSTKLIIRNLPWSVKTSEQLSRLFMSFGKVKFADLPKTNGKLKGFGFVTLRGYKNAEKALESVNGKIIDGRPVAVDWAVDKDTWEKQKDQGDGGKGNAKEEGDDEEEDDEEDDEDADEAAEPVKDAAKQPKKDTEVDADLENFFKNHMQNLEDESDDEESNEDEEDGEDEDEDEGTTKNQVPRPKMTDNSSTVFVRNLPFTTTDDQLKSFFAHFGRVRYARVVLNKATEKPAGTGFVCFILESDAKQCVKGCPRPSRSSVGAKQSLLVDENADPSGMYTLDGRPLQVVEAVNKEQAATLAEKSLSQRREKDKRRLFLLSEGAIGKNSPLFSLLSPVEVQMRQASAVQRRKMVQANPSLHLSLTRLAVRNMPRNVGSKELKELARKAIVGFAQDVKEGRRQPLSKEENARDDKDVKEKERQRKLKGKGIVRQAKVVFESNQGSKVPESSGAGKSRGYGFIEYTSHHWALMGLRWLNGHELQGDDGRKQRIIVEFAIENARVVQRRRAAEDRSAGAETKAKAPAPRRKGRRNEAADDGGDAKTRAGEAKEDRRRRGGKAGGKRRGKAQGGGDGEDEEKGGNETDATKQILIARKKLMRKKKAAARGGK
ncbi:RNA recognition motif containing protein [Ophiocordyceps camponoti-floridani]|uniref:RNA recognition motif containing protein n=1 Tax=Ophiocordyceps camponoti-floridani TaxID=2030778 RepID=A0A8H4Q2F9_9HYPO|nr:RNA recognition motif containing protein [Ophiocordyceps camponoti-floridani]